MTGPSAQIAKSYLAGSYVVRIEAHLALLAAGRDPFGHLFAIERLARAARAERWATERATEHEKSGQRGP